MAREPTPADDTLEPTVGEPGGQVEESAQRPSVGVSGRLGVPVHALLVTIPVGIWVGALAFDVASQVAPEPYTYPRAAYWLVVVGLLAALVAGAFGLADLLRVPRGTPAWRAALVHMALSDAATVLFLFSYLLRRRTDFEQAVPPDVIAVSVVSVAVLAAAVVAGARLAFLHGLGHRTATVHDATPSSHEVDAEIA